MSELVITAKCPHCESEDIREVSRVLMTASVDGWEKDDAGTITPADYHGDSRVHWDTSETDGYDCGDCYEMFPKPVFYLDGVKMEPG